MEGPPRLHDGDVEGLAVVGDDEIGVVEEVRHRRQQRALAGMAGQQKLPDLKRTEVEVTATNEERERPGAATQAGRLEIDEDRPRALLEERATRFQPGIQQRQGVHVVDHAVADPDVAMPPLGFVSPIDDEAFTEARGHPTSTKRVGDAIEVQRRAGTIPVIGLVGELANRFRRPTVDDGA